MVTWFQHFTTKGFDSMCQAFGMQTIALRHGLTTVITPTPIVDYLQSEATGEPTALDGNEALETWKATIPIDTLLSVFGSQSAWEAAVAHNQVWYTTYPNQTAWITVRTIGDPVRDRASGRVEIRLVADGIAQN
jgi:hypothetical protein